VVAADRGGKIRIKQIDPAELSPAEFTHAIGTAVEQNETAVVIIDSVNGYLNAMPAERRQFYRPR
jgi:circadian clock protein KaiC